MISVPTLGIRSRVERGRVSPIAREVKLQNLTYLSYGNLRNIESCLRSIRRRRVPGLVLEAGVALGGSGVVIASLMESDRRFRGYDVFGMIPPPGEKDGVRVHERYRTIASGESTGIGGDVYYGYQDDLYSKVCATFERFGVPVDGRRVSLHQGLFEDTLELEGETVAFAHLDCDWYDPVKLCLDRIYPALAPGGFIISDDYHAYDGARKAVDEFLAERRDMSALWPSGEPERTRNLVLTKT